MSDWNRRLSHYLPAWQWLKHYDTPTFKSDLLASFIVIAMLVPQGMAYAMLQVYHQSLGSMPALSQ